MGLDGRPSRSSKQRAMELVSVQQRREADELDLDGDMPMPSPSARRSRRKPVLELTSDDDDQPAQHSADSEDNRPLGTGTYEQHASPADSEVNEQLDQHPKNRQLPATPPQHLSPTDDLSHDQLLHDSEPNTDEDDDNDVDYADSKAKSVHRSLPLRIRVSDGVITKSGRISKPPKPISPELTTHPRARESRHATIPSREERYRRRSKRLYGNEVLSSATVAQTPSRNQSRQQRRHRSKTLSPYNGHGADEYEDDDEVLGKGQEDDTVPVRRNGTTRTGGRVVKMDDLESQPSARTRARSKPADETAECGQERYALRLRSRSTQNGIGKSGRVQRNGMSFHRSYNEEALEGVEGDEDYHTPDESEAAEELANDDDDDVIAQGNQEDPSDDDFMNHRASRISSRRTRKARPQRSIPSKRKRPRTRAEREQNSLALETQRSYRTRKTSLRREDFYEESDPSNESSESSEDPEPRPQRPRTTRGASLQPTESAAKKLGEVDFLKNPMAVIDINQQPRSKHTSRYIRRRSRLRPSGPEPTTSDGEGGPGASGPPIEPIQVDLSLSWDDIGGLEPHIRSLKEMVFLPLMYPEVFEKFHMEAPKGVLFYGPPGTGKTLCARALAASCGSITGATPEDDVKANSKDVKPSPATTNEKEDEATPNERLARKDGEHRMDVETEAPHNSNHPADDKAGSSSMEIVKEPLGTVNNVVTAKPSLTGEIPNSGQPSEPSANEQKGPTQVGNGNDESHGANPVVTAPATNIPKKVVKKKPRVSFFMRNGADCLSKWVGEAERQLRMTFEAAKRHEPAIIFFDEIDGLAPVRSSRQDQIHSSIVSTLLGLMDGLDSRGKIVVIGATNRVDAIDPALRRPGRFDRELIFTLPNLQARRKILGIHTSKWKPPPKPDVLDAVAKMSVGYCGADLKALCSESAIRALRRRYPQIYTSHDKLLIDVDQVRVSTKDFLAAMGDIVPASHRSARTHARPIPERLLAVLSHPLQSCIFILGRVFPQGLGPDALRRSGVPSIAKDGVPSHGQAHDGEFWTSSDEEESDLDINVMHEQIANAGKIRKTAAKSLSSRQIVLRPRLLLCGQQGLGQSQLGPALLHFCEGCPVHSIDYPSLHADEGARSAEEALISAFREACRSVPSVLYLPHLQLWWESAPQSLKTTLIVALKDLPSDLPVLVLATAECSIANLPVEVTELFGDMHELSAPSEEHRKQLFAPLVDAAQEKPKMSHAEVQVRKRRRVTEVLPKAPPPQPKVPSYEHQTQKIQSEDRFIRALRMEMRAFVENLLRDKRFKAFWNPVDPNSAPDYYEIIKTPMDVTQIAGRIDAGSYPTVLAMVNDFDVMMKNAIQYNPPNTETGAAILRRAHGLIDIVHAWVDNLNPALVETCNKIIADRISRAEQKAAAQDMKKLDTENNKPYAAGEEKSNTKNDDDGKNDLNSVKQPSRAPPFQTSSFTDGRCTPNESMEVEKYESPRVGPLETRDDTQEAAIEVLVSEKLIPAEPEQVAKLQKLVVDVSTGMTVDGLEGLYVRCEKVLHERKRSMDRASAVKALINTVLLARDDPALVGNLVE